MTPETETAHRELTAFQRRSSPEGRFVAYCSGRVRHSAARQVVTLFCFLLLVQMATIETAIAALALVVLADVAETLLLHRFSRRHPSPGRLPWLIATTAVMAAVQALSIVYFSVLVTSIGGGITRSFVVAICLAAMVDAALQLPVNRPAALTRLLIFLATLVVLFASAATDTRVFATAQGYRLAFDLVAALLLSTILAIVIHNMNASRTRGKARQAVALQKAYELAATGSELAQSRETAKRLAAVAEGVSDSIILTDREGCITWVNAAFTEMMGYTLREVCGQHVGMVNGPMTDARAIDALMTARREEKPAQLQLQNQHKDGRAIWVETRLTPILDSDGSMTSMIAVERNIEHIMAREAALAEAGRIKQAFLATVSHELRTPMNGIIGNAEMLMESPLLPDQAAMVRTIGESGDAMLNIVNDILDFSALEAGRLTVSVAPFDPRACLASVVDLLAPVAARKGISCQLDLPGDLPPGLLGDAGRIRQILSNLIGNAIKFTRDGWVRVEVSHSLQDGAASLRIDVCDSGIGIAPDRLAHVFESFTQADNGISGQFGGTGLGLAISRQLAEAMGGTLTATSRPGEGSVFTLDLRLPPADASDGQSEGVRPSRERGNERHGWPARPLEDAGIDEGPDTPAGGVGECGIFAGWTILIADDNATNRRLIAAMLSTSGATLRFAETGSKALQSYLDAPPDIVLMDVRMPELDGPGATRAIRDEEEKRGAAPVPVVALTANILAEDRTACASAGMTGFLTKPVRRKDLIAALIRYGANPDPARAPRVGTAS